jgi:hypothetical protein
MRLILVKLPTRGRRHYYQAQCDISNLSCIVESTHKWYYARGGIAGVTHANIPAAESTRCIQQNISYPRSQCWRVLGLGPA